MAPKKSTNTNPKNPVDPAMAQILDLLLQQMANITQQQKQHQPQPVVQAITFKSFQAVNPQEFKGTTDPVEAQAWLKEMEKSFDLVGMEDNQEL